VSESDGDERKVETMRDEIRRVRPMAAGLKMVSTTWKDVEGLGVDDVA
jgi:hypothetical protein